MNAKTNSDETPLELALRRGRYPRVYPILLSAGASLPTSTHDDAYLERVVAAGGWARYERLHLDRLTAMLTPKTPPTDGRRRSRRRLSSPLRRVPAEVLRRIVAFAFHVGYY